jgi:iron-sulfur cluster repair protein YtfE (RIC family)
MAQGKLPPCKCERMMRTLQKLGATHAARMHYIMEKDPDYQWTPEDWELHFRDEEKYVFPVLLRLGLRSQVQRLAQEHGTMRQQLRRYGNIDRRLLQSHSDREDDIILQLVER